MIDTRFRQHFDGRRLSAPAQRPQRAQRSPSSFVVFVFFVVFVSARWTVVAAGGAKAAQESAPRILYETSPRAVEYQLNRLSNDQLLRIERTASDAKYRP